VRSLLLMDITTLEHQLLLRPHQTIGGAQTVVVQLPGFGCQRRIAVDIRIDSRAIRQYKEWHIGASRFQTLSRRQRTSDDRPPMNTGGGVTGSSDQPYGQ